MSIDPKSLEDKLKPYPKIWYYSLMLLGADNAEPIPSELHLWSMLVVMSKMDDELHRELVKAYSIIPKEYRGYYQNESKKQEGKTTD